MLLFSKTGLVARIDCKREPHCAGVACHSAVDAGSFRFKVAYFIIIKLPDQAIASTPSAPRPPPGQKKEGAPLHYVRNYYAHPKLSQDTQQCS
jgi:hypothetical protein